MENFVTTLLCSVTIKNSMPVRLYSEQRNGSVCFELAGVGSIYCRVWSDHPDYHKVQRAVEAFNAVMSETK